MKIRMPEEDVSGFQMAPMIDIVFLLIIFFMVAANISRHEHIPVDIPVAQHSRRPKDPSGRGIITIKKDGAIVAGSRKVELEAIEPLVAGRVREDPNFKVFLRADKSTPHRHVRNVMKACAEGGVVDIIFATYESEP